MSSKSPTNSNYQHGPSLRCQERHRVLREAEEVGSVMEVCRRAGITKQTYYLWKKRYAVSGLLGLEDRPIPPSPGRPKRLTIALTQIILDHVKKYPTEGCVPLSKRLAAAEIKVSSPTIQKALIGLNLGSQKSRSAWVRAGCPPVAPVQPPPDSGLPNRATIECARRYFFFGIPRNATQGNELPRPTVEQVAKAIGASPTRLKELATRENWTDSRARYLVRVVDSELKERFRKNQGTMDSTAVTMAALSLQHVIKALKTSPEISMVKMVGCMRALRNSYHLLKSVFGGVLPVVSTFDQFGFGSLVDDLPPVKPKSRQPGQSPSKDSVKLAKRLFFLGLPKNGLLAANPRPSIRQVANRLSLPVRALQKLGTKMVGSMPVARPISGVQIIDLNDFLIR